MSLYQTLLIAVFVCSIVIGVFLLFIDAPYGKRERKGWGPSINPRLSWVLWEAPAFFSFLITFSLGEHNTVPVTIILASLFLIHYGHRTFIYPFQIRVKPGAKSPVLLLLAAMIFNAVNGWLNAWFITEVGEHLWSVTWFTDWRFLFGVLLFIFGFALAKDSDRRLKNLRKPGESGYKIPYGGGFNYVSCPNYLGEMLEWLGFAVMAWSPPGFAFVCFTAANLFPRALASHQWYRKHFKEYPTNRKAVFPWLI